LSGKFAGEGLLPSVAEPLLGSEMSGQVHHCTMHISSKVVTIIDAIFCALAAENYVCCSAGLYSGCQKISK